MTSTIAIRPRGMVSLRPTITTPDAIFSTSIARIEIPGLIVHAMDDPFIPYEPFLQVERPENVTLELIAHGGHLGYISRDRWLGDHRWLETRLATWLVRGGGSLERIKDEG